MDYSCRAKGSEINLWLHTGLIASCCKSTPVHITDTSVSSLLNHPAIQQQKAALDAGIPDPSCDYCWQAEKNNLISRRYHKNRSLNHKSVEITFDNTCNFTCLYCGPKFSSRWQSIKNTPVNSLTKQVDIPDLIAALEQDQFTEIQVMGGEPFMSKHFSRFIDEYVFKPGILYKITSNLCPETMTIWDKFFSKTSGCEIKISVSLDSSLPVAEKIRLGFDAEKFEKNQQKLYQIPQVTHVEFINTINCLTIFDKAGFDDYVYRQPPDKLVTVDDNYLEFPKYLNLAVLDQVACDQLNIPVRDYSNKKFQQISLVKFLIDMEKHSGVPLAYYNNLTCGFIQRIVTEYGIDTSRLY